MEKRLKTCLTVLLGLMVLAVPVPAMPPPLFIDVAGIAFTLSDTDQRSVTVYNADDSAGTWDLEVVYDPDSSGGWLSVDRDALALEPGESQTMNVSVDRAGREEKLYQAVIVLTERSDHDNPDTAVVSVTMEGPGSGQALTLNRELIFFTRPGVTAADLEVSNSGQGALIWSAEALRYSPGADAWLTPASYEGVVRAGRSVIVELTVARDNIAPGFYQAVVTIRSNGGDAEISVFMWVPPAGSFSLDR